MDSKIILAVDVDDASVKPSKSVWKILEYWSQKLATQIEAVHVMQYPTRVMRDRVIKSAAENALRKFVRHSGVGNLHEGAVLSGSLSSNESALSLVKYAKSQKSKMIIVMSHGRRWLSRFIMGSFSETLLKVSPIPVLFLGKSGVAKRNRFLFITNFSKPSKRAFSLFLAQVESLAPEIILYHALPPLYDALGVEDFYPLKSRKEATTKMLEWVKEGENAGFKIRYVIEENTINVAKAAQKTAVREKVSMIAFTSSIGNIAKEIFRQHQVAVWVCGPAVARNKKAVEQMAHFRKPTVMGERSTQL